MGEFGIKNETEMKNHENWIEFCIRINLEGPKGLKIKGADCTEYCKNETASSQNDEKEHSPAQTPEAQYFDWLMIAISVAIIHQMIMEFTVLSDIDN